MTAEPVGAESAQFVLTLPLTALHNSNHRVHWAVKARKEREMRQLAKAACMRLPAVFFGPVDLDVTFAFPDNRRRDVDNLSLKGAIDGIVDARVLDDDDTSCLASVRRSSSPTKAPKGHVTLTFTLTARPAGKA